MNNFFADAANSKRAALSFQAGYSTQILKRLLAARLPFSEVKEKLEAGYSLPELNSTTMFHEKVVAIEKPGLHESFTRSIRKAIPKVFSDALRDLKDSYPDNTVGVVTKFVPPGSVHNVCIFLGTPAVVPITWALSIKPKSDEYREDITIMPFGDMVNHYRLMSGAENT